MKKQAVIVFLFFLSGAFFQLPLFTATDTVQAKDTGAFEFSCKDKGENTCWITEIYIKKDKGISELKIPGKINGKTVVSIGVGRITLGSEELSINTFLMHDDPEIGWECDGWYKSHLPFQERRTQKIKKIILPDSIKEIKDYAFAGLRGLKSIKLSKNLTTIGSGAFEKTSVSKMHFPSNLTAIGTQLFSNSPINDINIPAKLKDGVADLARSKASWKQFSVSKKSLYYKARKDMLISKDGKTLYAMLTPKKNIRIPDSVKTIDEGVFYKASPQSVKLGAGVEEIAGGALSTKTRCRITVSPSNPYLAKSGMCIYRKKNRELLVGIPKGRVFKISHKVKKLVTDNISLVGVVKKYQIKKVYMPKGVKTKPFYWYTILPGFSERGKLYYY